MELIAVSIRIRSKIFAVKLVRETFGLSVRDAAGIVEAAVMVGSLAMTKRQLSALIAKKNELEHGAGLSYGYNYPTFKPPLPTTALKANATAVFLAMSRKPDAWPPWYNISDLDPVDTH